MRLADSLDSPELHPLTSYLYTLNGGYVSRVLRADRLIGVLCPNKAEQHVVQRMANAGSLADTLTQCLVTDDMLRELRVNGVSLRCHVNDWEMMTSRSQGKRPVDAIYETVFT